MKITIITDVFGKENNGTTITIRRLLDGLKNRGHNTLLVSSYSCNEDGYLTLPRRCFWPFDNYIGKNGVELAKPNKEILTKAIIGSDIVHIVLPFKVGIMASKLCVKLGVPFTTAFHCQPENFSGNIGLQRLEILNNYLYSRYNRKLYKRANRVHCPSQFVADMLKKHNYKTKNYVISNGVIPIYRPNPIPKPKYLKDKFCILFSARLSTEKRHDVLLKAVSLSKYADKIHVVFAGLGPQKERLKKLADKLNVDVTFNFFKKEDLCRVINYCDLYVHPSEIEIEGISCLEAMSCGLVPVFSNSEKAATKQFALTTDNLFIKNDYKDLAKKIDFWIENPKLKKEMSEKYIEFAKQFDINLSIDKMIEMFKDEIKEYNLKKQAK